MGYSIFFEQVLMRIGFMATAIMAAAQGTEAMAAHQVGMNIMSLSFSFGDGLQSAAVALIGYSLGAKDPDMEKHTGRPAASSADAFPYVLRWCTSSVPERCILPFSRERTLSSNMGSTLCIS